jgi:hypothetical protein
MADALDRITRSANTACLRKETRLRSLEKSIKPGKVDQVGVCKGSERKDNPRFPKINATQTDG